MVVGNVLGKAIGTNVGGLFGVAGGALLASNTASQHRYSVAGAPITVSSLTQGLLSSGRPQAR